MAARGTAQGRAVARIAGVGRNLAISLCVGFVLFYFSELLFWARIKPGDSLAEFAMTWLAYSCAAYVMLALASRARAVTWWQWFLVGALYGWFIEGVLVQTTYESLPLSISFTALAWHALISVLVGWWAPTRARWTGRATQLWRLFALVGAGFGLWAVNWWITDKVATPVADFALFAAIPTAIAFAAYWGADALGVSRFVPGRAGMWIAIVLTAALFVFVAVPTVPIALVVLPPLVGMTWWALRRAARAQENHEEPGPAEQSGPAEPVSWWVFGGALALVPVVATAVYALVLALTPEPAHGFPTHWVLYAITTPAGFVLYVVALVKALRAGR